MGGRSGESFRERNQMMSFYEEHIDKVRAARKAIREADSVALPSPPVFYAAPEPGIPECIADPECTRPVTRGGMCSRHSAKQRIREGGI